MKWCKVSQQLLSQRLKRHAHPLGHSFMLGGQRIAELGAVVEDVEASTLQLDEVAKCP